MNDINYETINGVLVVRLKGRLDISRSESFEKTVMSMVNEQPLNMAINFSRVTYMSSSGIRALLSIYRAAGSVDAVMCLCEVPPVVKKVIDVVEIGQIFKVFDREDEAIEAMSSPA